MFKQLADNLTEQGFDMKKTLREDIDIQWTPDLIKRYLWKTVQEAICEKESTTQITTQEINQIFGIISKAIGERCGIELIFPSIETIFNQQRNEENQQPTKKSEIEKKGR